MSGPIPSKIGNLDLLWRIWLSGNQLTGTLPSEIGNINALQRINIAFNSFSGQLPDIFESLPNLDAVVMSNNVLTGLIPDSLWHLDKLRILSIRHNELTGTVPDSICHRFQTGKVKILTDTTFWFQKEPKVKCPCCKQTAECYVWDTSLVTSDFKACPSSNLYHNEFHSEYYMQDRVVNFTVKDIFTLPREAEFCLSSTGCYELLYYKDLNSFRNNEFSRLDFTFSNDDSNLSHNEECDAVNICDSIFDSHHPKRAALNHITQLSTPNLHDKNSPQYKALCWVLTKDELFDQLKICDGTLIQRYVLALLFSLSDTLSDTLTNDLTQKDTCEWDGIECDQSKMFVNNIMVSNANLVGSFITEIGILQSLQSIDLSKNALSGTIDPDIFINLRNLKTLNLSQNRLEGRLPNYIFEMEPLNAIILSHNQLAGTLSNDIKCSQTLGKFQYSDLINSFKKSMLLNQ